MLINNENENLPNIVIINDESLIKDNSNIINNNSYKYIPSIDENINHINPNNEITNKLFNFNNLNDNYNYLNNLENEQKDLEIAIENNFLTGGDKLDQKFKITNIIKVNPNTQESLDIKYNDQRYLYENEIKLYNKRNYQYMEYQQFINPRMRKILLDWILEISSQFKFKRSTFHLTVVLLDSFLSQFQNLEVSKLQLTGVTCLEIAAKFEVKNKIIYFFLLGNSFSKFDAICTGY